VRVSLDQLVEFLTVELKAQLPNPGFRYVVVTEFNPKNMLKEYAQTHVADAFISIKEVSSTTRREYNLHPLSEAVNFEVGVWLIDTPHYRTVFKVHPRDTLVTTVKRLFLQNPKYGVLKATVNAAYEVRQQLLVLCTQILVTHLDEALQNLL
jgi:hypothetical protein